MHLSPRERVALAAIGGLGILALTGLTWHGPIAQDPAYHCFADGRTILGIPNFWNVVTNAPFVVVGALGLGWVARAGAHARDLRVLLTVFFSGVLLTGFGSAYYHWAPTSPTLFWDRLPLTLAFMSLFALAIRDRAGERAGRALFWPLVVIGPASILWWRFSGDLRWYALVQFFPMAAIPLILCYLRGRRFRNADWWVIVGFYAAAKLTELLDHDLHLLLGFSGHAIKHLLAAVAPLWVWRMVQRGAPAPAPDRLVAAPAGVAW